MAARSVVWFCALLMLSGCGTLYPERYVTSARPDLANANLETAVKYNLQVSREFKNLQSSASSTLTSQNLATLGLASLGAAHIAYDHSINRIKGTALALGVLAGVDMVTKPKTKRAIVDQGQMALACVRHIAFTMDALPAPLDGTSPSRGNPSGVANFVALVNPAHVLRPASSTSGGSVSSATYVATSRIRQFAGSLEAHSAPNPPADTMRRSGPAFGTPTVRSALMPMLLDAADMNQTAMNMATTAAQAAKGHAPEYLVMATEMIASSVLSELHSSDPTSKEVSDAVSKSSGQILTDLQTSLVETQKKLAETEAALKAARTVSAATQTQASVQNINNAPTGAPADPNATGADASDAVKEEIKVITILQKMIAQATECVSSAQGK